MVVPPPPERSPATPDSLGLRIALLEQKVDTSNQILRDVSDSISRLVRLEERHANTNEALGRAFKQVRDLEGRVSLIERDMPSLRQTNGWVVSGVVGIVVLVGGAVLKLVLG